jgi:mono/diheme cytochrome c family protein
MLILDINVLSETARTTALLRYPTPAVVNPAFADAVSLGTGKGLYDSRCAACHGAQGLAPAQQTGTRPPDLRYRLPERRDEELYSLIKNHPGLASTLSDDQVWNVINYLRSTNFALPPQP